MSEDAPQLGDAKTWLAERLPSLLTQTNSLPAGVRFTLRLPEVGSWTVDLVSPSPSCSPGEIADADCTLDLAADDLMRIVAEPDVALELYDAGRIGLTGSVDAALEVVTFFHRVSGEPHGAAWTPPDDPQDFVYNPLAPSFDENPHPVYEYLRKHQPVFFWKDLRYWLLSKYEDVRASLTDPRLTTDHTVAGRPEEDDGKDGDIIGRLLERSPLRLSDERQAIVRKLINPVLSVSAIQRLRPEVERLVADILAPLDGRPVVNMVDEFTEPLPRRLMEMLLGIPAEYQGVFERFSEALMDSLITRPQRMNPKLANEAVTAGIEALREVIKDKRKKPGPDVLSAMIASERQGERLDDDDLLSLVATLVTTGVDSSVYALNQTLLCLLRFPEQCEVLRQEPALTRNLLDEVLRFDNFHKLGVPRWAVEDLELRGKLIRKGEAVAALLQSAGRDEEVFPHPDVFDLRRDMQATLTFGHGRHSCVGAAISQLEFEVAVQSLLQRFPDLRPAGPPSYRPQIYVRAVKELPVSLRGKTRAARRTVRGERAAARPMELRALGRSGLDISALSLGTVTFGDSRTFMKNRTAPREEARRIFDAAVDAGVNLIDTADVYSEGQSEELVGGWIRGKRDRLLLATKCRYPIGFGMLGPVGPHDQGLSRQHIMRACEDSLRRLGTDVIDLYQVQAQDTSVPIEETLRALDDLVKQGKVRHVGCATYSGYRLVESLWAAERAGTVQYDSAQVQWSLLNRGAEREVVPACRNFGLGLLAWSPLAQGFLTGKYKRGVRPTSGSDAQARARVYQGFDDERNWKVLELVERMAAEHETTPAAVSLAWLLKRRGLTSIVVTARSVSQLHEHLEALDLDLSPKDVAALDEASEIDWGYPYSHIGPAGDW
jgi:aryl-alcohol dehydrogenase-like predicted oxidoreductase/cytochrome P450